MTRKRLAKARHVEELRLEAVRLGLGTFEVVGQRQKEVARISALEVFWKEAKEKQAREKRSRQSWW